MHGFSLRQNNKKKSMQGSFINRHGQTVTVTITTADNVTIGDDTDGLFFSTDALSLETGYNDSFDVIIAASASLHLQTRQYRAEFYQRALRGATVTVAVDDTVYFVGSIEPRQYAQDFSGGQATNDIELLLIDCLAALQYVNYAHIGEPGITFTSIRATASTRSFLDIIREAIACTPAAGNFRIYYDGSKALHPTDTPLQALQRIGVSDALFMGDEEDDVMTYQEVVAHCLRFLNLHITQRGRDFFIFSWETLRADQPVTWTNLDTGRTMITSRGRTPLTTTNVAGTRMDIDMGETYNKLVLSVEPEDASEVIASPLDTDAILPMFRSKQLYMTQLWTQGDGEKSRNAFEALLTDQPTTYDAAHTDDYYLLARKAIGWQFGTGRGDGTISDWSSYSGGRNQQRIPGLLRKQIGAALLSVGKVEKQSSATDNSLIASVEMTDYLAVSVNGNLQSSPTDADLRAAAPVAVYTGNKAGGVFSPSDDQTTNYIVFSGSVILNPRVGLSLSYLKRSAAPGFTVNCRADIGDGTSYMTCRWYRADTPMSQPTDEEGTAAYGATDTTGYFLPQYAGWEGFYPWTDKDVQLLPFNYSRVGDSSDNISKVPALECMLRVGDKVAVENKEFDDTGIKYITINGKSVPVRYGSINNISWQTFRSLDECRRAHPGDEDAALDDYYSQTITIGFDPKIGDYIIGQQYSIQNNIDYTLGLDVEGMAIPVRHSDHLSGRVSFEILGPVNSFTWQEITRRHRTWFRSEKWTENAIPVLSRVSSILLRDFKVELHSDNGLTGADLDTAHRFVSSTDEDFFNVKDDLEFTIHSALTTAECEELHCANAVAPSCAIDLTTGDAVLAIVNFTKPDTEASTSYSVVKAERDYIDSYYNEYHTPRITLSFDLDTIPGIPFARYTHPALSGRIFATECVEYNFFDGTTAIKAKEI